MECPLILAFKHNQRARNADAKLCNQLRMLLAALGYVLIERLRALALQGHPYSADCF